MTDKLKILVEKLGTLKSNRCSICGDYDYGKSCSCGQMVKEYEPILIGDIIFKINQAQVSKLVQLWRPFGNKSLQEIGEMKEEVHKTLYKVKCKNDLEFFGNQMAGNEFEWEKGTVDYMENKKPNCFAKKEIIKDKLVTQLKPQAQELINFLTEIL